MNYYELSFTYTSPIEKEIINDVLAAELGEIGFESFTESEKGLLGYISEALYDKKTLDDKLVDFPLENTRIDYTSKWVESKDWNEEWEKNYFKPIRIGSECIIRASFHEAEPGYRPENGFRHRQSRNDLFDDKRDAETRPRRQGATGYGMRHSRAGHLGPAERGETGSGHRHRRMGL